MTGVHIYAVASQYEKEIAASGVVAKENGTPLQHICWMCKRIQELIAEQQFDRAHTWLGFVQGVLFCHSVYVIDEMRDHNRTPEDQKAGQDKIVDEFVAALDIAAWPTSAMRVHKTGTTGVTVEVLQPGNIWRTHHLTVNDVKEEAIAPKT